MMIKVASLLFVVSFAAVSPCFAETMAVVDDVDVYDEPGGGGEIIDMLRKGKNVDVYECREDNWCSTNEGWVWGDFLKSCIDRPGAAGPDFC